MRQVLLVFLGLILALPSMMAQSPSGTISGLVLDPSGAAIAGAEVLIANDATGVRYSGKTNGEGVYVVPNLPPGSYRVQVSRIGFKTLIKPDILLNVQDALSINFMLPIGAASEVVTVIGGAPLVNTENAAVSTVIDRNFVESLPLNGRSFNTLLQLTPGVVIASHQNSSAAGQFSISGQRTSANNFTVDGVSANFGVSGGVGLGETGTGASQAMSVLGGTSSLVSVDALQEFRIETSSFAPEFGKAPGGQVLLTTRAGTNEFHGSLFDYFRNTVMDANDWFANQAGKPRAAEHHNDFGATLGGPLRRDRSFFFFSYEGARLDQPQTTVIQVPSEYARTTAPAVLAPYLSAYPKPDDRTVTNGVYTAPFTGTYSNRATLDAISLRLDHTISSRFAIFGRYSYAPSELAGPVSSLSTLQTNLVNTQTLTVGANMAFRSSVFNALRGNYSMQTNDVAWTLDSFGGAVPPNPSLFLGSLPSSENQALFFGLDTQALIMGSGGRNKARQLNFTDDLSYSLGKHQLKFGADYRAVFLDVNTFQHELEYIVLSTQSFLSAGAVPVGTSTFVPTRFLSQSTSFYAQDRWKASSRLNLTWGLRWEIDPAPSSRGGTMLSSWENVSNPAAITLAPAGTPLWATKYGNFAPRVGLAYSLKPKGDFVLRAGAGIFYDLGIGSAANLAFKFPNSAGAFVPSVPMPPDNLPSLLAPISLNPPYLSVAGFSPDLALPRSYQWNVALEKSLGGTQVVSATYVGQAGRDLLRQKALFQPNSDFASDFLLTENDARSNYNALQVQYRRPVASGLQALFNYTWSHSLDNASDDVTIALSNTIISGENDYASSGFDVRHSLSGALSYEIPAAARRGLLGQLTRNWSVGAVVVARTGFPFNALLRSPSLDPGGSSTSRPDRVPGAPVWIPTPGAPGGKILNASAFVIPSVPRQGTEGRNDIPGFGLTQVDATVARQFPLTDRLALQFRADAFNMLNHPNFANPGGFIQFGPSGFRAFEMANLGLGGLNPLFQEGGPRSLQLSLKLTF
jgi:hypothetical protein